MRVRRTTYLTEWLLLLGGLLVLGAYLAWSLHAERKDMEEDERERLSALTRVIHDNLGRQFDAINLALTGIRKEMPRWRGQKDGLQEANRRLTAFVDAMPGVRTLIMTDASGKVLASNRGELLGLNFRQRDYFQAPQRQPNPDTLYIGPPYKTVLDVWAMNIVRMIPGPNGEFGGVVSATLDPDEFKTLLESVRYTPDVRASIAHGDGILFLLIPAMEGMQGRNLNQPGSLFAQHRETGRSESVSSGLVRATGDYRMIAQRDFQPPALAMDKLLNIAVSRDLNVLFQPWLDKAMTLGGLYALLAAVTLGGLHLSQRRRRVAEQETAAAAAALREKSEELESFFNINLDLLCIADLEGRFHKLNPAWTTVLGHSLEALEGACFLDFVHPDDREPTLKTMAMLTEGKTVVDFTNRYRCADGSYREIEWHSAPRGALIYAAARDVTEQRLTQAALKELNARLEAQSEQLRSLAFIDGLTGVANRRRFDEQFAAEWRRCRRDNTPLALLMIDIDHFKRYNDHYGHQAGDACLVAVATLLKERLGRSYDLVARYGGEEFVCLLPDSDLAGACAKAEELREAVAAAGIAHEDSPTAGFVTISLGVAAMTPDEQTHPEALLAAADAALYAAKSAGRNCVGGGVASDDGRQ